MFPTQRQPLATFTPNTLMQIQTKETCSTAISFKYVKPVWHKSGCSGRVSPSKRPRQSEDICGTKKSKKSQAAQAVKSKTKQLATRVAEVQLTLVQICAQRMQLKTAVVKMTVSTHMHRCQRKPELSSTHLDFSVSVFV